VLAFVFFVDGTYGEHFLDSSSSSSSSAPTSSSAPLGNTNEQTDTFIAYDSEDVNGEEGEEGDEDSGAETPHPAEHSSGVSTYRPVHVQMVKRGLSFFRTFVLCFSFLVYHCLSICFSF
jgi:hypothetical protein